MIPLAVYQYSYLPLSETFIYRQLQGLTKRFNVKLYTMGVENTDLFPGFTPIVVPNKSIMERLSGKYTTTTFTPTRKRFIVNLLKDVKLLYVNFGHMALSMEEMAAEAGIPLVAYFHGVDASAFLRNKDYVGAYAQSKFHTVFTNSENMRERLRPYLPAATHIRVVPYGIDPGLFPFKQRSGVPRGAIFLQVSRLDFKKGVDVTLQVFARYVREVDSSARLIIAGEGPLKLDLERQASALDVADRVQFLGKVYQPGVVELMHQADVLLQHSVVAPDGDMEGVPNVLIEAMACGLPVVSTYHSGIPELVRHGENGFLVHEKDAEAYFQVLRSLSVADVTAISENARRTVTEGFTSEKNNDVLCSYISSVADSK